jgi:hypothetical protein
MTALATEKARRFETWKYKSFTLASGTKAYKGGRAALNSSGKVVPATSATGLLAIGVFHETVDATAADKPVTVDLEKEIVVERFVNATAGDACASTDVGQMGYMMDDQTVTKTASGRSVAGRIWDVSSSKGVAIEKLEMMPSPEAALLKTGTLPGQVGNDFILTAGAVVQDAQYDVGTTAAASTVTLPAAAADGSRISFVADGTKNGHTVQYRDATGPANLTTALTASKKHLVVCQKLGGLWFANAYVSP